MKKMTMAMAAALLLAACEKNESDMTMGVNTTDSLSSKTITFSFGQESKTRSSLTELSLTDLWIFDYAGETLIQTLHQSSSDEGFGSPTLSLEYGEHTLYFVASRGANPVVDTNAKTITWGTVRDTFHASLAMNIQPSSSNSQSVSLSRVVGRLTIALTDIVPATASKFVVAPAIWYYGLRYDTGAPVGSIANAPLSANIPDSYIGTQNLNMSVYSISSADAWTTDVSVSLIASDESAISTIVIQDVPIQRNHIISYSGSIVGAISGLTIGSTDEWIEDTPVQW